MLDYMSYPQYYNVDDIPVKLDVESDEVVGTCGNGSLYPIEKTIVLGYLISFEEYQKMTRDLYEIDVF